MKKLLLLLLPVLLIGCVDYTEDFNTINGRLDALEESVPSIEKQVKSIVETIESLEEMDEMIEEKIKELKNEVEDYTHTINLLTDKDLELDQKIAELRSYVDKELAKAKSDVAAAYATIEQFNSLLQQLSELREATDKLSEELTAKINTEIKSLSDKIADLENRLKIVEDKVEGLLARIQSVSYIPEYSDGKALVERMGSTSWGTLSFRISPKDAVAELANVWESAISCEAVYTKTRAVSLTKLAVTSFEGDTENGIITIKISGEGMSEEFFAGTQEASVALIISDGNNSVASDYVPMLAQEIVDEIRYTTADGNVLEPKNSGVDIFGANIISNTYENGVGIIKFDGPVTMIGNSAFGSTEESDNDGTYMLQSIVLPRTVTTIDKHAFAYCCDELIEIVIPDNVISIGRTAFGNLAKLERVTLGKNLETLDMYTFSKCTSLKQINIPEKVTEIPDYCFRYCESLERIDLHPNIKRLGTNAFYECTGLKGVYITDLAAWCGVDVADYTVPTTYAHHLYLNGQEIVDLVFPAELTVVKPYTFRGLFLNNITLHNNITLIGSGAFAQCDYLKSVTIPESVENIEETAFHSMTSLEAFYGKFATEDHRAIIVDGRLVNIASAGLINYSVPEGVTTIGREAFKGVSVKNVTIPASVKNVDSQAFYNNSNIQSLRFKSTVPPALYSTNVFTDRKYPIYVPAECVEDYKSAPHWKTYASLIRPYDEGLMEITYTSTDGNIVVPYIGEANSYKTIEQTFNAKLVSNTYENGIGKMVFDGVVTKIGEAAFYQCLTLKSINIPAGAWCVGQQAFDGCRDFEHATIPEGVTRIYDNAFHMCDKMESIALPNSITTIDESSFFNCKSLKYIYSKHSTADNQSLVVDNKLIWVSRFVEGDYVIPDGVTYLGNYCIGYPVNVITVTLPESVKEFSHRPFIGMYNISAFYGKYTVNNREVIQDGKLWGAAVYGLKEYSVSEGVKRIAYRILRACKFEKVTLPASLEHLEGHVFENCDALRQLYCKAVVPPTMGDKIFLYCSQIPTIYVPASSVNAYKTAEGWKDYADNIAGYNF